MKTRLLALVALALSLAGCRTTCADPQNVVDTVAAANPDCTRLTLHCKSEDGSAKVCASTDAARVGTASDPEDLQAMTSGETVVLDENGALDVTVPIFETDGAWTTVCGVTIQPGDRTREQAIAQAKVIAAAVKAELGACCANGTCCQD